MIPGTLVDGDRIVPSFVTTTDHPWLRVVLDEHQRFVGQRRADLDARFQEPLPVVAPALKLAIARRLLTRLARDKQKSSIAPPRARRAVFARAAELLRSGAVPRAALDEIARRERIDVSELEESLFADLPSQRRVAALPEDFGPAAFATEMNAAIVAGLMRRALSLRVHAWGSVRAVVRQAHVLGLLVVASALDDDPNDSVELSLSGPLALFRRTTVYGRALGSLVQRLTWCAHFELEAWLALPTGRARLHLKSGDPIGSARELAPFDSQVEARFARDFAKRCRDWQLMREPRAVVLPGERRQLCFPDFELVHRRDPTRRWLVEIVGFWTPEYLNNKLQALEHVADARWIVCVDERLNCGDPTRLDRTHVVPFRRRVDLDRVIAIIDRQGASSTRSNTRNS
jgi:hypothetical protein